jgi:hypothetical protein
MADYSFRFDQLDTCDLLVGAVYETGPGGSIGEEPLNKVLRCGNMGGFRIRGGAGDRYRLVALYTTFDDSDWPDMLDGMTARFIYFGDNKEPGRALHDTPKGGNELLRRCFDWIHIAPPTRQSVPPFFVFSKVGRSRDVRFHGLAAPGALHVEETEDLVAIWKTKGATRFQNYRAVFTILDAPQIPRAWIDELVEGHGSGSNAPEAWREWIATGTYRALPPG